MYGQFCVRNTTFWKPNQFIRNRGETTLWHHVHLIHMKNGAIQIEVFKNVAFSIEMTSLESILTSNSDLESNFCI